MIPLNDIHIRNASMLPDAVAVMRVGLLISGQKVMTEQEAICIAEKRDGNGNIGYIVMDSEKSSKSWRKAAEGLALMVEKQRCSK